MASTQRDMSTVDNKLEQLQIDTTSTPPVLNTPPGKRNGIAQDAEDEYVKALEDLADAKKCKFEVEAQFRRKSDEVEAQFRRKLDEVEAQFRRKLDKAERIVVVAEGKVEVARGKLDIARGAAKLKQDQSTEQTQQIIAQALAATTPTAVNPWAKLGRH